MGRRFSGRQRWALLVDSSGFCAWCGVELEPGWHADHMTAYARGGATDSWNGQALCPRCNHAKGAGILATVQTAWPDNLPLRQWMCDAFAVVQREPDTDVLIDSTPGAGKTRFGLYVAHDALYTGLVARLVVVVPTTALRRQWAKEAATAGLRLSHEFLNEHDHEHDQYHGIVVTYQQVAANPDVFRRQCRRPTFVIFDEPHHMGESYAWGEALKSAFEYARRRLLITGTAFRSDNSPIPFVQYVDGKCRAHKTYTYGDALQDGIVRPVYFPSYEGQMSWFTARDGPRDATFRDELDEAESMQRLRTALSVHAEWLPAVIRDADVRLSDIRESIYPDAAGLIIAMDQHHARGIADLVREITGVLPSLAVSDDPTAGDVIERFKTSKDRWIVAVRMVSEGIDIPRLCVGVYATNILTEMFFRQAVGRLVRITGVDGEAGWWFIPRDSLLVAYVQRIKEQREHALSADTQAEQPDQQSPPRDEPRQMQLTVPIGAIAEADDVFFDHDLYSRLEILRAEAVKELAGLAGVPSPMVARLLRANSQLQGTTPPTGSVVTAQPALAPDDALKKAKQPVSRLSSQFAAAADLTYKQVYWMQTCLDNAAFKGNRITLDQLEARRQLLLRLLSITKNPWAPTTYEGWLEVARAEYARC